MSLVTTLLLALVAWWPLSAQRAELERRIRRDTLPNGLEIIVVENHGVPLTTIEAVVRNGSFTQSPTYEGLSHLYEHMFFKANRSYPEPDAFVARASQLGAVFNAQTREELVNYYLTVPSDSTEPAVALLATALRTPLFLREELDRERSVVIGEYDRIESDPFYALNTATGKALWGSAWSRKNPLGERDVILKTTPEQMRTIQRKYYVPNNTALIVTGDIDAPRTFAMVRKYFADWSRAADPFAADPIPPVPPLTQNKGVVVEQPVNTVIAVIQWDGPGAHADVAATYAADVFSDVLNQPGSRFQRKLVDSGLWQSMIVNYYTLNQVGPITIAGQTTPDRLKEAIAALQKELERLADPGYITPDQLTSTKAERAVSTAFGFDRPHADHIHTIGFWWSVSGLEYYMGYIDNMASQTLDDLRAYARKYIVGKPTVVGILLPPGVKASLGLRDADVLPRIIP